MLVGITIAVWAFLKPIEGDLLSLVIVFFLNFFFGYLSGLIANREDFELKKALRCIAEATIFFVLCCAHLHDRQSEAPARGCSAVRELCDLCSAVVLHAQHSEKPQKDVQA